MKHISIPIWMHESHFYMFYPYEKCSTRYLQCNTDPRGVIPATGYAYALRFKHHQGLANQLIDMLDFTDSERYCIHSFIIEIFDVAERPLYEYEPFKEKSAMLRALNDLHEGDELFQIRADRQNLAILMVSLGFAKLNNPAKWTSEDVYDIIKMGDRIFCNVILNDPECKGVDYNIGWEEINLVIGMNKFNFTKNVIKGVFEHPEEISPEEIEMEEEEEIVTPEDDETATATSPGTARESKDLSVSPVETPSDLMGILKKWDTDNQEAEAILECGFFNLALWKKDSLYYVFDSKASGPEGELTDRRLEIGKDKANNFASVQTSKYYKTLDNEGSAYVVWFEEFQQFFDHIKGKIPADYLQQEFTFNEITLQNMTLPPPDIPLASKPGFKAIAPGKSIIRGTISQNDLKFVHKDKQEAANCICVLAFALVSSTQKWSQTFLDIILKYGDRLYTKSLQAIDEANKDIGCVDKLRLSDIVRTFKIYKIRFDFDITGPINDMLKPERLKTHLGRMDGIEKRKGYIIICKGIMNTVWKAEGQNFLFEPKGSDPNGKLSTAGQTSVLRFAKAESMFEFLASKFNAIDGPNTFELYTVSYLFII